MSPRPHPPAMPHGEISEVFPDVFFVTGAFRMPGPVPIRFSRNMTIVREGDRLVLVNAVRLGEEGLKQLDALGKVTDVIRIAAYHGSDDPFYKERYGAGVWSVQGQRYVNGFNLRAPETYLTADHEMIASTQLPLAGASLHLIASNPVEGLVLLDREGGILISGDALQNWFEPDAQFNTFTKVMMRAMGFIKPYNVGPAWLKQTKPPVNQLRGLLDLRFDHVLPAHGGPARGGAKESFRPRIEAVR